MNASANRMQDEINTAEAITDPEQRAAYVHEKVEEWLVAFTVTARMGARPGPEELHKLVELHALAA